MSSRVVFDGGATMQNPEAITTLRQRAEQQNNDYPEPGASQESQISTLAINKKRTIIKPSSHHYNTFEINYGNENYSLRLAEVPKVTKELVVCLTQHAIRLKKHITFVDHYSIMITMDSRKNEIVFVRYGTEHNTGNITRTRQLELPNNKIKFDSIETEIGRRIRLLASPVDNEKIGYEFNDLKKHPIAYMSSQYGAIMLLWNVMAYREIPVNLPVMYLDYILTNYSAKCDEIKAKAIKAMEEEKEKRRKIEYTGFIDRMFHDSINAIQSKIQRGQADMDTHMRGLLTKGKELDRDGTFLLKLRDRSTSKEIKEQLEIDYKLISQLRKTNKYTSFRFDAGSIVGRTSMIKFFNKYQIGEFDVYLSLNGVVKCHNKTYVSAGEYDHPHISHGNPCWGNLGDSLFNVLRKNQFGAAFDLMYEFLIRYCDGKGPDHHNRPYKRLEEWNPAFRQQGLVVCSHCGRIKELCGCGESGRSQTSDGVCLHCGRSYNECRCERCPAAPFPNNIIGVHVDCDSDCEHYDREERACGY